MINKKLAHLMCGVGLAVAAGCIASQAVFAHDEMKKGDDIKTMHDDMMAKMDTNHDGMISAAEHAAYAKQMFDNADTNHDGMLSKDEMEAMHKSMHGKMEHHDSMHHDAAAEDKAKHDDKMSEKK